MNPEGAVTNGGVQRLKVISMKSILLAVLLLLSGPLPGPELLESMDQDLVQVSVRGARRGVAIPLTKDRLHRQPAPGLILCRTTGRGVPVPAPPDDLRSSPRLASRPPPAV